MHGRNENGCTTMKRSKNLTGAEPKELGKTEQPAIYVDRTATKLDDATLDRLRQLARLIGRQLAREQVP